MPKKQIAIIGAGQSGLLLAIGLVRSDYCVTLYSDRTPNQILNGKIMSSQGMFGSSLKFEKMLGLNFWDSECPKNNSITFNLANPVTAKQEAHWIGKTRQPFQSIDQRLKFSRWLEFFEQLGGNLIVQKVIQQDLENISKENDLTIIATGKGELGTLFKKNEELTMYHESQRKLSCIYVKGTPYNQNPGMRANLIPGIGEFFSIQGVSHQGLCEMMLFEGIPGGPFDCWNGITNIEEQIEVAHKLLKRYLPWEAEYYFNMRPADPQGNLLGGYAPFVKDPIYKLPSGRLVLGMGDAILLNDPISGQGANNATKAATFYLNSIVNHRDKTFDEIWMNHLFDSYWNISAKWATMWSNMLLNPPLYIADLLKAAAKHQTIANTLANGFDEPSSLFPWISSFEGTKKLIENNDNSKRFYSSKLEKTAGAILC